MRYPLTIRPDRNGTIVAQAVDAPGALTVGRDEADAIAQASDALMTLFAYLISEGELSHRVQSGARLVPFFRPWPGPSSPFIKRCMTWA
jgi:predicted RNase H-like HicB family nuclease